MSITKIDFTDSGYCHIYWKEGVKPQSDTPKCQNVTLDVTLEESTVLSILAQTPKITQAQLALEIKKSVRTVKRIMASLQKKQLIYRKDGKRNGEWIVISPKVI